MTKLIEEGMINWHSLTKEEAEQKIQEFEASRAAEIEENQVTEEAHKMAIETAASNSTAFAKITEVKKDSPADKGGLKVGDEIIEYGACNYLNHNDLKHMVEITRDHINQPLRVYIRRKCFEIGLTITPGPWSGPGILGCRFDKL